MAAFRPDSKKTMTVLDKRAAINSFCPCLNRKRLSGKKEKNVKSTVQNRVPGIKKDQTPRRNKFALGFASADVGSGICFCFSCSNFKSTNSKNNKSVR
jgi:hypothetical protein